MWTAPSGAVERSSQDDRANIKGKATGFATLTTYDSILRRTLAELIFSVVRTLRIEGKARCLGFLHHAYWIVLRPDVAASGGAPRDGRGKLLFLSSFTGDGEAYLSGFGDVIPAVMNTIWGQCRSWKKTSDRAGYLAFVRLHERRPAMFFNAYRLADVHDIAAAQRIRRSLEALALQTQLSDAQFAEAYQSMLIQLGPDLA